MNVSARGLYASIPSLASLLAVVSGALPAQGSITAPPGYTIGSAGYYAPCKPLAFFNGHTQIADPSLAKSAVTLSRLEFRTQNHKDYDSRMAAGRRFSSVTLALGHCDATKMTSTFSTNFIGSSTAVHSAAVTLATYASGKPKQTWGNAGAFPFSKTFAYNGKNDLLMDWTTVSNGALTNGQKPYVSFPYFVDAGFASALTFVPIYPNSPYAPGSRYLPHRTPQNRCADSAHGAHVDAYPYLAYIIYGDNYQTTSLRGKAQYSFSRAYGMAKSAPYAASLTVFGFDQGVSINAQCNPVYVNIGFRIFFQLGKTDYAGNTTDWIPKVTFTFMNEWAGAPLYAQVGWDDSKTKRFALTKGAKIVLPKKPTGQSSWPSGVLLYEIQDLQGKKFGPFGPFTSPSFNYTERFVTK